MTRKELWNKLVTDESALNGYIPYPPPDDSLCKERMRCEIIVNKKLPRYIKSAVDSISVKHVNAWLGRLISGDFGEVAEAYAYGIFREKGFLFNAPCEVQSKELYSSSTSGSTLLDGVIENSGIWFDIKSLPQPGSAMDKLLQGVNIQLHKKQMIATLDGPLDYDGKIISSRMHSILREKIIRESKIGGRIDIPEINSSIRIHSIRDGCFFSTCEYDTFKFAHDNRYQVLSDACQIPRKNPFALIFVYTKTYHQAATFQEDTLHMERALARRIFMELKKDRRKVSLYCGSADPNISIARVSSSIGAIVFLNASYDLEEPSISIFLNPNARKTHRIKRHHIDRFMNFGHHPKIWIDDFEYDNY